MTKTSLARISFVALISSVALHGAVAVAASGDWAIDGGNFRFSSNTFLEGKTVRIYSTATNNAVKDLYGVIRFYEGGNKRQIGTDQSISAFAGKTDDVFVDWTPNHAGQTEIVAELIAFDAKADDPKNNTVRKTVMVEADFDRDGIADSIDPDLDNDGVTNDKDTFPKDKKESADTDGDGIGDNADTDRDNDGFTNDKDALPLNSNEHLDNDKDGIGDKADPDDDNDGLYDGQELAKETNPLDPDTDKDKVLDGKDAFPLDPKEWFDTDNDDIGDNIDKDKDNDGIENATDAFPTNLAPVVSKKNDGLFNGYIVPPDEGITFDASGSSDPDGKIQKVTWKIDEEKPQEGITTKYMFAKTGSHQIKLSVTDNAGETVSRTYSLYVTNMGKYLLGLLLLILIGLAIFFGFKYSSSASNGKRSKHSKK